MPAFSTLCQFTSTKVFIMTLKQKKVLLVDGLNRSGLAIARALKCSGDFRIDVAVAEKTFSNTIRRITDFHIINRIHFIGCSFYDSSFSDRLVEIVTRSNTDIIIPIGPSAVLISKIKPQLEKLCKVLIEDYEKVLIFHDKSKTLDISKDSGVPHPATWLPENIEEVESLAEEIKYPFVIKARKGSGADGVWYAKDKSELIHLYSKVTSLHNTGDGLLRDSSHPMLQEYISGELHDVTAFCINGEMKLGLTQKRLMTRPVSGGMGIVNVTTKNEQLLQYAEKIIDRVKWNGVMLMDFIIDDRDGRAKLLEINPRFWGTTGLTIKAGYNYPYYLVLDAYGLKIDYPSDYKKDLNCRWPLQELFTVFEKPFDMQVVSNRLKGFISRFTLKNCIYEF